MKFRLVYWIVLILVIASGNLVAQRDSLIFNNGNYIVGEVKKMTRNTLTIETDYSDDDFTIEWDGISEIYTETYFLISLTNGNRYNGYLASQSPGFVNIITDSGLTIEVDHMDIVYLDDIDKGFWSQLYASIDIGFELTKANSLKQLSIRSNLGFMAKRWQLEGYYNTLSSVQDDVEAIKRTEGGISYRYFLPHDWYPLVSVDWLSNTEQALDLRSTAKSGMGKYIIHTNYLYWGFSAGANYNNEIYSADTIPDRDSWEGFFGTEINLFNIGDLNLMTSAIAYPGITERGRWRVDFKFDAKYDLPLDFYIKAGYTLNYDNKPAPGSSETDYVLQTGFGWEW